MVVCPVTSKRKPYPFALPVKVDGVEGAILVDQLKAWTGRGRQEQFHSKAEANAPAESAPIRRRAAWNSLT